MKKALAIVGLTLINVCLFASMALASGDAAAGGSSEWGLIAIGAG